MENIKKVPSTIAVECVAHDLEQISKDFNQGLYCSESYARAIQREIKSLKNYNWLVKHQTAKKKEEKRIDNIFEELQ